MIIRISGPRIAAMVVAGLSFALLLRQGDNGRLEHYRSMSHDALLAELTRRYTTPVGPALLGGLFLVGVSVVAVDLLTPLCELVWTGLKASLGQPKKTG